MPASLKTVVITGGTIIAPEAFAHCENLISVTLPDSVKRIEYYAFNGCSSLTSVTFGSGVTTIAEGAFYECNSLTILEIPDSVTSIGRDAFLGCSNLTEIVIPDSVTSIGECAFRDCIRLTSITLPFIGNTRDQAYNRYLGLIFGYGNSYVPSSLETVVITGGTSIDASAFAGCSSLISVTLPENVTSFGDSAFSNCTKLAEITFPENLTSIGQSAFLGCSSLTSVVVPDSVTSIGEGAFRDCNSLISITIPFVGQSRDEEKDIHFGYIFGETYLGFEYSEIPASLEEVIITGGSRIGDHAFSYCSNLVSVILPDTVKSIGYSAFAYCKNLASMEIPEGVTSIGACAFEGCENLVSIVIPDSLNHIGYDAFWRVWLKEVHISSIENWCGIVFDDTPMRNDTKLYCNGALVADFVIPEGVTRIEDYALSGSFKTVTIPSSVTSIGYCVFYDLPYETGVYIIYNGTKEQWGAISKGYYWYDYATYYTIQCIDGYIIK